MKVDMTTIMIALIGLLLIILFICIFLLCAIGDFLLIIFSFKPRFVNDLLIDEQDYIYFEILEDRL